VSNVIGHVENQRQFLLLHPPLAGNHKLPDVAASAGKLSSPVKINLAQGSVLDILGELRTTWSVDNVDNVLQGDHKFLEPFVFVISNSKL
jgi:hypothetical protein